MGSDISRAEENILKLYVENERYLPAYQVMQRFIAPHGFSAEMRQARFKELRDILDQETLCTIICAAKEATVESFKEQSWYVEKIEPFHTESYQIADLNTRLYAQGTYFSELCRWNGLKTDTVQRLKRMGDFSKKLAFSAVTDENYQEVLLYLDAACDIYRTSVEERIEKNPTPMKEYLSQLLDVVEEIESYVDSEKSAFPLSRETHLAAAEKCDYSTPDRVQELASAATAPSEAEISQGKREKLSELKEKLGELFSGISF